ncbi:MAG: hypothetical protein JWM89_2343 [Acidimicrobiales bacterium]|nr:hypothetical protein [Acidimicrobiales bacterium]
MSAASAAQLAFAAEFALFLVAVAGVACAVRPGLLSDVQWARSALASGFLGLATASFLRGALVVERADEPFLIILRLVSGAAIAAGLLRWRGRRSLVAVVLGLLALGGAGLMLAAGQGAWSDTFRSLAAVGFAVGLVSAARRSISARIAVNAAALVLGVVLVVAVAVSVTVADNVEGQAKERYAARAASEADAVADRARSGLGPARVVSGVLAAERIDVLQRVAAGGATPADAANLTQALKDLTAQRLLDLTDPVVLVSGRGAPAAVTPQSLPTSTRLALAGDPVVAESIAARAERQGITLVGGRAYALATAPVVVQPPGGAERFVGVIVVARPLDQTYLRVLGTGGERLSFALATSRDVVARTGSAPSPDRLREVAADVVERGGRPRLQAGGRFLAAAPVAGGDGRTVLAFIVSAPADAAEATRRALFRTLFVVALGSALVAVVVAILVGERIGRGLRQLTAAAQQMQAGSLDTRIRVRSDDELGVLGGAFSSMADSINLMTAELRAAALEEATVRARLEAVISGMSEALIAVDRDGIVIELNRAAEELLATSRAELLGRRAADVVSWRALDGRAMAFDLDDLVDGEPIGADLAVGDGSIPVVVTAGALQDAGTAGAGFVLVLRDVRREREVDDMKSSILANIGHELRSPLTPIKGYAGMLRDRKLTDDQTRTFASEIIGGVDQLERVVRQLVTFATIAAGRLTVVTAPVAVDDLATRIRARWEPRMDDGHELRMDAAPDLGVVPVDFVLLDQAVDELVDNAMKYSPEGGPITIGFTRSSGPRPGLVIRVTDEGVGMPPGRLVELADAFSQGDASETRRFGGLGLGLACADRIVRGHGGVLSYESIEQEGTTVSILLSMESAATGAPT